MKIASSARKPSRLLDSTAIALVIGFSSALASPALAGPAACTLAGSIATCSGDQSAGIASGTDFPANFTILNVNGLTGNIAPALDTNGIVFSGTSSVEINSNLGNNAIILNGFAEGVIGSSSTDVTISHFGDMSGGFRGINADSSGGNVVINAEGDIADTAEAAINAHAPGGTITIGYEGDITGAANRGIGAYGDGDISITQSGAITAGNQAIYARSESGSVTVQSSGALASIDDTAILAEAQGAGQTASVNHTGDITAEDRAISALSDGNATITVTGDTTSTESDALHALSQNGSASITSTGTVQGDNQGIFAMGRTGATIDSEGNVTANRNDAIFAFANNGGDASVVSVGDVSAGNRGVVAMVNFGSPGNASIDSTGDVVASGDAVLASTNDGTAEVRQIGDVTSTVVNGIRVYSGGATGGSTLFSRGSVTAQTNAIDVAVLGSGDVSVDHAGDIVSFNDTGVRTLVQNAGDTSITIVGDIDAHSHGIFATTSGSGAIDVTMRGDVTTNDGHGISAYTANGNITIDSIGDIASDTQGIYARGAGAGNVVNVTSVGDISSGDSNGIQAEAMSAGGTVSINSTGDIEAGDTARAISAIADGNVQVVSAGDLTATNGVWAGQGIYAESQNGTAVVVSIGDVNAGDAGIKVDAANGATIESQGNIVATDGDGIFIYNAGGSGNSFVSNTGDVTAGSLGIVIRTFSDNGEITSRGDIVSRANALEVYATAGGASITSIGDITSTQENGIRAYAGGGGDILVQSQGVIDASSRGIETYNSGNGNTVISQTGDIGFNGGAVSETGVTSFIAGNGNTTITVDGDIAANKAGILAYTQGTGSTTINHTGDIVTANDRGISAQTGGDITINNTGDIQSGNYSIYAVTFQAGASVVVNNNGAVSNNSNTAIHAISSGAGGTVEITQVGDVTYDGQRGVFALANGNATVDIMGSVTVVGPPFSEDGVVAQSSTGMASITIVGDVTAGNQGIFARGSTGATIDSTGTVNAGSFGNDAILAYTDGGPAAVTSVGDVTAGQRGVTAITMNGSATVTSTGTVVAGLFGVYSQGSGGDATVVQTGNVTSTNDSGVAAYSSSGGNASVTVDGDVSARLMGIVAHTGDGNATVNADGLVTSSQDRGIVASTVGGTGGDVTIQSSGGVNAFKAAISGLASGGGGDVTINNDGDLVSTHPSGDSIGILAFASNGSVDVTHTGDVVATDWGINAIAFGAGNNANVTSTGDILQSRQAISAFSLSGSAHVDSTGDITSTKQGLFALGGSGGASVMSVGDITSTEDDAIFAVSLTGDVTVNSNGAIAGDQTGFDNRFGIFAFSESTGIVSVTQVGSATTGGNRRAIHAQSDGIGGHVTVDVTGNIFVAGNTGESDAIFVLAANGTANVTVRAGSVITGGSDALASFGVEFGGGTGPNTLMNYGTIDDANGGKTIGGGTGAEIVTNHGIVDGDFYLAGGANRFDNMAGGQTFFRAYSQVGAGNDFNNFGIVSPFGVGTIGNSVLDGNMTQSGSGTFVTDIDFAGGNSDYLKVTGDMAAGGFVSFFATSLPTTLTPYTAVIIETDGAVTDNGIIGAPGPVALNVTTTPTTVEIAATVDFGAQGALQGNQAAMGGLFDSLFTTTIGTLTPEQQAFYLALLNTGGMAGYQAALDQLSGESANLGLMASIGSAEGFSDRLFSCKQRDGQYRYLAEGSCYWGSASGVFADHDGGAGDLDYTDRAAWLSGGAQMKADNGWVFGFGLGYESGNTDVDPNTDLDREMFSGGVVAKLENGGWLFGASLSGGFGTIDSTRRLTVPVAATATADRSIAYGDITGRAAYLIDMQSYYIKPIAEASLTHVWADGYTESGAGVANLTVGDQSVWAGRGTLAVEMGWEQTGADGTLYRPHVLAGVTLLSQDISANVGFAGLGPQTATLTSDTDPVAYDVKVGLDVLGASGWVGTLAYDGRYSDTDRRQAVSFKLSVPF